jgi:Caspase domain
MNNNVCARRCGLERLRRAGAIILDKSDSAMLKRHLPSLLLPIAVAALLSLSVHAHAQTRVALVIGNSAYQKVVNLANPAHDAQDVSESLKRLGFTVKTVVDADFDGLRRALLEFGRMAPNADMAVFYFAGHGVEINGHNWLLPTDVELKSDVDAGTEAIGLQSAMQAVAAAKTLGLVILDACRNNPFQSSMKRSNAARSVQILGLASVEPADNVLVAYAPRDGTVAADGAGRNSPYAAALLKHIETPGLEVDFLFRNIRDDVMAATNNEQQAFVYGSLSSNEIYFKAPAAGVAAADPGPPPDAAEIAWSFLKATNDISTLGRFVERFPESSHVSDVKVRIASLATAPPSGVATDAASPPVAHVVAFADTAFRAGGESGRATVRAGYSRRRGGLGRHQGKQRPQCDTPFRGPVSEQEAASRRRHPFGRSCAEADHRPRRTRSAPKCG